MRKSRHYEDRSHDLRQEDERDNELPYNLAKFHIDPAAKLEDKQYYLAKVPNGDMESEHEYFETHLEERGFTYATRDLHPAFNKTVKNRFRTSRSEMYDDLIIRGGHCLLMRDIDSPEMKREYNSIIKEMRHEDDLVRESRQNPSAVQITGRQKPMISTKW